jgi:hypothetical protein
MTPTISIKQRSSVIIVGDITNTPSTPHIDALNILAAEREVIATSIKKTKFCRRWLGSGCCKVASCGFAHSFDEMGFCLFGEACKYRDTCTFRHPNESQQVYCQRVGVTLPNVEAVKQEVKKEVVKAKTPIDKSQANIKKTKLCSMMMQGKCVKAGCTYAHSYGELTYCLYGSNCRYKNGKCFFRHEGEDVRNFMNRTGIMVPIHMHV